MKYYFMFDRGILQPQGIRNAKICLCQASKDREHNPMFGEDFFASPARPWEVRYDNAYPNIIYDAEYGIFRCYYTLIVRDEESARTAKAQRKMRDYVPGAGRVVALAYAQSADGVHWEKPNLGRVEFDGSKENNLLFIGAHGTGVFLDEEETNRSRRYKLVTRMDVSGALHYMAVNFSEDGLHWGEMRPWPRHNPKADTHNFPFRDRNDGKFKVITRTWRNNLRLSAISESTDFINWTEPREILRGTAFESQVYSMPVFYYKGVYLGLASMFHEGDRDAEDFDCVDCELTYATQTDVFDFVSYGTAVIPRGAGHYPDGAFDCGCIYAAAAVEDEDKLWIYYMGGNGRHTNFRETALGRAWIEKDRFAFLCARDPERESLVPTMPVHFDGETLEILCEIEDGGELSAALYDQWNGCAYVGFDFADCCLEAADEGYRRIRFALPFHRLQEKNAVLMLHFRKAKVYALRGDFQVASHRY